ncbi:MULTISPECIES: FUSC family protein [unclassified Legionella]|uniref:FUSC family protein n=1 Tax=unclassified Legionella TaxID=2622702 RepID=UPI0013EFAC4F|nr:MULTISPECIES: FUSC family protein [unclassified Legionella]MDI9817616.1 FUSC family protein [Legionella sp. PL877]
MRTAIAAVSAILISFSLHLDKPYWAGMTVVILANIYVGSIIDKAILRIVGTVIGVWVGFFLAGMVANSFLLYLLANLILITVAVYYYNFSPHAYAYLLGALGAFIVIAQLAINPGDAFYVAIWRPVEIGIGVLVSAAAAFCLFPNNIRDNLNQEVSLIFDLLSNLFEQLNQMILTGEPSSSQIAADNLQLKKKLKKSTEMIGFMRRELGIKREKIDQFRLLLDLFYNLTRTVTYFISSYERPEQWSLLLQQQVHEVFLAIHSDLNSLKEAFYSDTPGTGVLQTSVAVEVLNEMIKTKSIAPFEELKPCLELMPILQQTNAILIGLGAVLLSHQLSFRKEKKFISGQQQASKDPDVIKHSIKAGLAAVLALVFWLVSDWPGGLNGIVSSVIISIRKNLFEMKNISLHRFLGCISGGSIALFPLVFFALNLYALIVILFFAVWFFSYCSFKYTRYSYIGLQANIALIIALAQAGGAPTDLVPPLERLGGIIIGIAASFLVGNILWRSHPLTLLVKNIRKIMDYLKHNMEALLLENKKLYDLTDLFWLTRGLLESMTDEQLSSKNALRFGRAKKRFSQLIFIQSTLDHIYQSIDIEKAHDSAINFDINLYYLEERLVALYREKNLQNQQIIQQQMEDGLEKIDLTTVYQNASDNTINFIDYIKALKQLMLLRANF